MKRNVPKIREIDDLISAAENLRQMYSEKEKLSVELRESHRALRKGIREYRGLSSDFEQVQTLGELKRQYQKEGSRHPHVEDAIHREAELSKEYDRLTEALRELKSTLEPKAAAVCAAVQAQLMTEYTALLDEIAALLVKYCDGDQKHAALLAEQTPAAGTSFRKVHSCNPILHDHDLAPALRQVRLLINP